MRKIVRLVLPIVAVALLLVSVSAAQQENMAETQKEEAPSASVTFSLSWKTANPQYFKIEVTPNGVAQYSSRVQDGSELQSETIHLELSLAQHIFSLAQRANYFQGSFDYTRHKVSQSGEKTLSYADAGRRFSTTFNWSENSAIEQLTQIFQGLSETVESGRKLHSDLRYDRLGINADLQTLEDAASSKQAVDLQLIAPLLQQISADPAMMHIAQQRARRLLALATRGE